MSNVSPDTISVLHVEDDPNFADLTAAALEREDDRIAVQTAPNPNEGLKILTEHQVDCIVSDYEMPEQNGIEFLEAVRDDNSDLPFILYTGKGSEEIASEAISAGVTDYLQKSGGMDQYSILANRIRNAVKSYRAQRAAENTERQLQRVYGRITDGVFSINTDWEYTYVNDEGARHVGHSREELIDGRVWDVFPEIVETPFEDALRTAMDTQETVRLEEYYPPHDTWYNVTIYPAECGISIYFRDITDRVERERKLEQLRERTLELRYTETVEETVTRAVAAADDIIGAPLSGVHLINDCETVLEPHAVADAISDVFPEPPSFEQDAPSGSRASIVWDAYREDEPLHIDSLSTDDRVSEESPAESVLLHPLGDHGVFIISSQEPYAFTETDRVLVELLANNLEASLDRVTREQLLRTRETRLEQLHEATRDLIQADSQQAIAERTVDAAEKILDFSIAVVRRYDPDEGGLVPVAATEQVSSILPDRPVFTPEDGSLNWEAYESGAVQVYDDIESLEHAVDQDTGLRSLMLLPLGDYGTVSVGETTPAAFDDTDEFLALILSTATQTAFRSQAQQEELERTNAVLSTLFDALPQGILAEDESRQVLTVNDHLFELFEMPGSPETATGRDCERMAEEVREIFDESEGFVEQINERITEREPINNEELELADGQVFERSYRPIELPAGDGHLWIYQDMTERRQYEEMITNLHDVAADLTACESKAEIYNQTIAAAASLLEFDRAAIAIADDDCLHVKAMSKQMPLDERPTMSVDEGIAGKTYRTGEAFLIDDAETTNLAQPQADEICGAVSVPVGEYGVFQVIDDEPETFDRRDLKLAQLLVRHTENALDLREHKRELQQRNDRLEEFANIISHDLRNPLNVASIRLSLLAEESDSEHLAHIERAHDRMEALIESLLMLAREGHTGSDLEPVDLDILCEDCWATVETSDATLVTDNDRTIRADESQLKQLFENLVRNAIEHGGGNVTVTIGELVNGFYVEDDGPGIPEDERGDVFEVGYSTSRDGVGFGLSIVKQIVAAHNWEIEISEGTDEGARFEITGVEFVDR